MPIRLNPIQRKMLVAEPPVLTQFNPVKLAEIVSIQLQQIGEDWFLLLNSGYEFDHLTKYPVRACSSAAG